MMYLYIAIALLVGLLLGKALFGKRPLPRLPRPLWPQFLPPRRRMRMRSQQSSPPLPL